MLGSVNVWFPEGLWFDFFNGLCYNGNKTTKVHRNLEEYPVFCKAGAIIPTVSNAENNELGKKENMTVYVFPGAYNTVNLYEDSGDGDSYQKGEFVKTEFDLKWDKNNENSINLQIRLNL